MGGYWGLYDANGAAKFAFVGPVIAEQSMRMKLLIAVAAAVIFVVCGALLTPRPSQRALALLGGTGRDRRED